MSETGKYPYTIIRHTKYKLLLQQIDTPIIMVSAD